MQSTVKVFVLAILSGAVVSTSDAQLTTGNLLLNYDAQVAGNTAARWKHNNGSVSDQFDWALNGATLDSAVTTGYTGITAAYRFNPSTNNELVGAGSNATDAFDNLPGGPSDKDASWEFWFRPDSVANNSANDFVLWESGGSGTGSSLVILNGDTLRFTIKNGNDPSNLVVNAPLAGLGGEFIQAVATYDKDSSGTNDNLTLYVNGSTVTSMTGSANDWDGGDNASLGERGSTTGGHNANGVDLNFNNSGFAGEIGIFRFYNDTLTSTEVLNNFQAVADGVFWRGGDPPSGGSTLGWFDPGIDNWYLDLAGTINAPSAPDADDRVLLHTTNAAGGGNDRRDIIQMNGDREVISITALPTATFDSTNGGVANGEFIIRRGNGGLLRTLTLNGEDAIELLGPGGRTLNFDGGGGSGATNGPANLAFTNPAGANINVEAGTVDISFDITQAASLTKNGAGTLRLGGDNSYAGATNVAEGVLIAASDTALGATTGNTTVQDGAVLQLTGGITIGAGETITINGTGPGNNGAIRNVGGNNEILGTVTVGNSANIRVNGGTTLVLNTVNGIGGGQTLTLDGNGAGSQGTIDGVINSGGGNGGIIKIGNGTWVLTNGGNNYGGQTRIDNGILSITAGGALGDTASNTDVNSGGQLQLNGGITTPEDIVISGDGGPNNGALRSETGNNTVTGTISMSGDARINVAPGSTLTLAGDLNGFGGSNPTLTLAGNGTGIITGQIAPGAGDGDIIKTGGGTWELQAAGNNVTGDVDIEGGTIHLNGGTMPNVENLTVGIAGSTAVDTLRLNMNSASLTASANSVVGDDSTGLVDHNAGNVSINAQLTLGAAAAGNGTYDISGGNLDVSGALRVGNNGTGTLDISGTGNVIAAGAGSNVQVGRLGGSTGNVTVGGAAGVLESRTNLVVGQAGTGNLTVNDGGTVIVADNLNLSNNNSGEANVTIAGGTVDVGNNFDFRDSGTDTVTQTGGSVTVQGNLLQDSAGQQDYLLQGGVLSFADRATSSQALNAANDSNTASEISLSDPARFQFTGGQLENVTSIDMNGSGPFTQDGGRFVVGNDGVSDLANAERAITTVDGGYLQNAGSLVVDIFGAGSHGFNGESGGSLPIDPLSATLDSDLLQVLGDATLNDTLEVELNGFEPNPFAWYDVLLADDIELGPNFAVDGVNLFRVIDDPSDLSDDPRQLLQVAVPEPAALAIWLVFGLACGGLTYARLRKPSR